jgi:hypothetical protein
VPRNVLKAHIDEGAGATPPRRLRGSIEAFFSQNHSPHDVDMPWWARVAPRKQGLVLSAVPQLKKTRA